MKLNALQREILTNAVASELAHGVRKPISCWTHNRAEIEANPELFVKAQVRYVSVMWKLLDAGVLVKDSDSYASISSIAKAQEVLESGVY